MVETAQLTNGGSGIMEMAQVSPATADYGISIRSQNKYPFTVTIQQLCTEFHLKFAANWLAATYHDSTTFRARSFSLSINPQFVISTKTQFVNQNAKTDAMTSQDKDVYIRIVSGW